MPSYTVNRRAVAHVRKLIEKRRYVLNSDWGEVQPTAEDENRFLKGHSWKEYGDWYIGLTDDQADDTKARYAFVVGDFKRVHRTGLIACQYRAASSTSLWRHSAAHRRLQLLDRTSAR